MAKWKLEKTRSRFQPDKSDESAYELCLREVDSFTVNQLDTMPYYELSPAAFRFASIWLEAGWAQPFDWVEWKGPPEAVHLRDGQAAFGESTPEQTK